MRCLHSAGRRIRGCGVLPRPSPPTVLSPKPEQGSLGQNPFFVSRGASSSGIPCVTNKPLRQPFIVNSTLQRFGISSSASHQSAAGANVLPTAQSGVLKKKTSFAMPGIEKIPPYNLLFRWIDEIILDYVHHEVSRNMVLLYLRLYLLVFMKDTFIAGYDLLF